MTARAIPKCFFTGGLLSLARQQPGVEIRAQVRDLVALEAKVVAHGDLGAGYREPDEGHAGRLPFNDLVLNLNPLDGRAECAEKGRDGIDPDGGRRGIQGALELNVGCESDAGEIPGCEGTEVSIDGIADRFTVLTVWHGYSPQGSVATDILGAGAPVGIDVNQKVAA